MRDENTDDVKEALSAAPSLVRPYSLTNGRTQSSVELAVEARIHPTAVGRSRHWASSLAQRIMRAASGGASVTEIAAGVRQPLGVVRVVLGDLISAGAAEVERTMSDARSAAQRRELIERTLSGLRAL